MTLDEKPFASIVRAVGAAFFPVEFVAKLPLAMTLVGVLGLHPRTGVDCCGRPHLRRSRSCVRTRWPPDQASN